MRQKTQRIALLSSLLVLGPLPTATAQIERWVYTHKGAIEGRCEASGLVQDPAGNLYVAGTSTNVDSEGVSTGRDLTVVGLTAAGEERWVYKLDGPGADEESLVTFGDEAHSIVYGNDGNLYIAGKLCMKFEVHGRMIELDDDFAVISLDTSGRERWVYVHDGGSNRVDEALALVYGADDNIYAAGYVTGSVSGQDFAVVSLDSQGEENWIYGPSQAYSWDDRANAIVYGNDHCIYVAGDTGTGSTHNDFTIVKLVQSGEEQWVHRYDAANSPDEAISLVYGDDDNIYAAGNSVIAGVDHVVHALARTGETLWTWRFDCPECHPARGTGISYGSDGEIYSAGWCQRNGAATDIVLANISATGDSNWELVYNGPAQGRDFTQALVLGEDGNMYIAGSSQEVQGQHDFAIMKSTSAGDLEWMYTYASVAGGSGEAMAIMDGVDGNVYAAGYSGKLGVSFDFIVVSLGTELGAEGMEAVPPAMGPTLEQNFPNPFNPRTSIRFVIPDDGLAAKQGRDVRLAVYDLRGELVAELVDGPLLPGVHTRQWDGKSRSGASVPSGVYIFRLSWGGQTETRKMVITK